MVRSRMYFNFDARDSSNNLCFSNFCIFSVDRQINPPQSAMP